MVWKCDCKCVCGACKKIDCGCECHMLDPLSDYDLRQLLVNEGKKSKSDVYGCDRNRLMKILVTQTSHPMRILQEGVKIIQKKIMNAKNASLSSTRLKLLERVAERGDRKKLKKLSSKTSKQVIKPTAGTSKYRSQHQQRSKDQSKSIDKKKTSPKKRSEAQRLARCKP